MGVTAISVSGLGKQYFIGGKRAPYQTLRESMANAFMAPFRRAGSLLRGEVSGVRDLRKDIWALKDVTFEVEHGEVVGIVGHNGAGKTTLLRVLSRITDPTEGAVDIYGRVGSLLEVGTGFHPELTGRENIYLNGAILGMRRTEVERKFDEIVDFSGVEQFIDTPVKYFSSGMSVRLAFSVAAHLDPEILLVDEVLAVGDAEFQRKCLGKMESVAGGGRTVLFVSHDMTAITSLCQRALLLKGGKVIMDGPAPEVVEEYLDKESSSSHYHVWPEERRPGNRWAVMVSVTVRNGRGEAVSEIPLSEDVFLDLEFEVIRDNAQPQFAISLHDTKGTCVLTTLSNASGHAYHLKKLKRGRYISTCRIHGNLLNSGRHLVSLMTAAELWSNRMQFNYVVSFDAVEDGRLRGDYHGTIKGATRPQLDWQTRPVENGA